MPFTFLRYLQPVHYFRLKRKDNSFVFPIPGQLPQEIKDRLIPDERFISTHAIQYDLAWQAVTKGFIDITGKVPVYTEFEKVPVADEYRFIRKYFHSVWGVYVLLIRLMSFNNPFREVQAFFKTRHQKRSKYLQNPIDYPGIRDFDSGLIQKNPLVTVVIPTLNRYDYLKDGLKDLENQDYRNFEVIVVDQSRPFQADFYRQFNLKTEVIYQEERALWLARNRAVQRAKGAFLLLYDDDSRVHPDWISNHLKALDYFNADISSGVSLSAVGDKIPGNYAFYHISSQLDTGNVMIKKDVFRAIGLFDRQFEKQRMGDGEFGLRAYLSNFKNVSNPDACRIHLKVGSGGLREMGSWDGYRPKKLFAPRPVPSVLYLFRNYFGNRAAVFALIKNVPPSIIPYRFKKSKILKIFGSFLSILLLPVVLVQISISWKQATRKMREGEKIDKFTMKNL